MMCLEEDTGPQRARLHKATIEVSEERQGFDSGVEDGIRLGVTSRRSRGDVTLQCPTTIRGHSRIKSETSMIGVPQLMTLQLTPGTSERMAQSQSPVGI